MCRCDDVDPQIAAFAVSVGAPLTKQMEAALRDDGTATYPATSEGTLRLMGYVIPTLPDPVPRLWLPPVQRQTSAWGASRSATEGDCVSFTLEHQNRPFSFNDLARLASARAVADLPPSLRRPPAPPDKRPRSLMQELYESALTPPAPALSS